MIEGGPCDIPSGLEPQGAAEFERARNLWSNSDVGVSDTVSVSEVNAKTDDPETLHARTASQRTPDRPHSTESGAPLSPYLGPPNPKRQKSAGGVEGVDDPVISADWIGKFAVCISSLPAEEQHAFALRLVPSAEWGQRGRSGEG